MSDFSDNIDLSEGVKEMYERIVKDVYTQIGIEIPKIWTIMVYKVILLGIMLVVLNGCKVVVN